MMTTLPKLRDDIKLFPGPPLSDGSPTWTLHDPIRNRFFRIGWMQFELLARWHIGDPEKLLKGVSETTTLAPLPDDLQSFVRFLSLNQLLAPSNPDALNTLKLMALRKKESIASWLLHHYLFIRIPLIRPDGFLNKTLPLARLLVSPFSLNLFFIAAVLSMFLMARQWESFIHTFLYFFTFQGIIFYGAALFLAKIVHELGHAYTSKFYGLKVPTMGVAFLVMYPMLYTDNSEAWKLTSRKARMQIVGAGTAAELVLAVIATLMWCFLQDGPLRSACFIMATLTWVRSLMMNLSPFMRFDGYYMLSDFLDVPNLQDRAFALGRWQLRKLLWGIDAPVPELFDEQKHRILLLYAYATWTYRLILFTGIAVLVYHTFFKALGIFLFWVEMGWFVIRPIFNEFRAWDSRKGAIQFNMRIFFTLSILTIGILLLIFPWNSRIHSPALLKSATYSRIYPPFSAQLREIHVKNRQHVRAGDLLFVLESPQIAYKEHRAGIKVKTLEKQLERLVGKNDLLEQSQVVQRQLAGSITELEGYRAQKQRMRITAPISGVIMDMTEDIKPGQWIGKEKLLGIVADRDDMVIEAYLSEDALKNVGIGDVARFYAENGDDSAIFCSVREIDRTSSKILKEPYLASIYGGEIAVKLENKALVSHQSQYRVILRPMEKMNFPDRVIRGNSIIYGEAQSILHRFWQQTIAVLVRESGF